MMILITADEPTRVEQAVYAIGHFVANMAADHLNEFVTAVGTVWIAIFTGVLAIATVRLWNSTAHLAKFAEQQAKDMKASIAAAQRSADIAERALVLTERPWIQVSVSAKSQLLIDADYLGMIVEVQLKNIGHSPALGSIIHVEMSPMALDARRKVDKLQGDHMLSPVGLGRVLFPNDQYTEVFPLRMPLADFRAKMTEFEMRRANPVILAIAYYKLPTGGKTRHTIEIFDVMGTVAPNFDGEPGRFSVHIQPSAMAGRVS